MAEGGYDPMDETTDKDPLIPDTGDDDDDDPLKDNIDWEAFQYPPQSQTEHNPLNQGVLPPQPVVSQYL